MNIDYLSRSMKSPVIDRVGFTDAVMMYLQLPFREPQFDRMLVEALVSTEFFAFRDFVEDPSTAWNADPGTRKAMTRALKQPWLDTLQDYAVPFTYFGVVALGVEYAHIHRWVGDNSREMLLYLVATIAADPPPMAGPPPVLVREWDFRQSFVVSLLFPDQPRADPMCGGEGDALRRRRAALQ